MTPNELASELDNTEYPPRLESDVIQKAIDNNLVVVFGGSDDLMIFEGAIVGEVGVWNGGVALVDRSGLLGAPDGLDNEEELSLWVARKKASQSIEAKWCEEEGYSWTYDTNIKHSTFDVVEGNRKYCRALVFSVDDI